MVTPPFLVPFPRVPRPGAGVFPPAVSPLMGITFHRRSFRQGFSPMRFCLPPGGSNFTRPPRRGRPPGQIAPCFFRFPPPGALVAQTPMLFLAPGVPLAHFPPARPPGGFFTSIRGFKVFWFPFRPVSPAWGVFPLWVWFYLPSGGAFFSFGPLSPCPPKNPQNINFFLLNY